MPAHAEDFSQAKLVFVAVLATWGMPRVPELAP